MNQFSSPNEEIIDVFKELWCCDSKDSFSNTEKSFEGAGNVAFNGKRYEVSRLWRNDTEITVNIHCVIIFASFAETF